MRRKEQLKKQMENKTVLIWKMGIASAVSWEIAKAAGSEHPYLAPLAVVLCLQTTINRSILFSYHKMAGTVIGIIVVVLLEQYFQISSWALGVLIIIGGFIVKWLKWDETAIHQAALTIVLVFLLGHKSSEYPIDRFRDTLIGAIIAVIIQMMIHPPNYVKQSSKSCRELSNHLSKMFAEVAEWIQSGLKEIGKNQIQTELRTLSQDLHIIKDVISDANDSLLYNPLAAKSKKELLESQQKIFLLSEGFSYLNTMIGTLMAWSEAETANPSDLAIWTDQFYALSSFFQTKETPAAFQAPAHLLKIEMPEEIKQYQYSLALYNHTILFIKKLTELHQNNNWN